MVKYDFYRDTYLGSSITEAEWPQLQRMATDKLNHYKRIYTVTAPAADAENLAVCAMADAYAYFEAAQNGTGAVASASIGSVSVSYGGCSVDVSPKAQERELYRCACTYLEIYRGVGGCR